MSEPKFQPGDRVIVNRGTIATIKRYSEADNVVVYEVATGGSKNTVTGHISHTVLEPLAEQPAEALEDKTVHPKRDGVTNTGPDDDPARVDVDVRVFKGEHSK